MLSSVIERQMDKQTEVTILFRFTFATVTVESSEFPSQSSKSIDVWVSDNLNSKCFRECKGANFGNTGTSSGPDSPWV